MTVNSVPKVERWFFLPPIICAVLLLAIQITGRDIPVFLWLNQHGRFASDTLWIGVTTFGDGLVLFVLILPFIRRRPDVAWSLILAFLLIALFIKGLKTSIVTYRPLSIIDPTRFRIVGAPYRYNSFPSGHAASAAAFAGTLYIFFRQRWVRGAAIGLALLVAFSRIAMGLHWATDVLVGLLGGWVLALLAYLFSRSLSFGTSLVAQIIFAIVIGGAAIRMILINHTDYPQALRLLQTIALASIIFTICEFALSRRNSKSVQPDETARRLGH